MSEETATLVAAVDGGEVWTSEAVAGLVGQRPRIAVPWGGLGETEILDARKVGDGIHVTFEVPASAVGELLEMGWRWPSDEATRPARVSLGYLPHGMRARLREWGWATGLPGGLDRCPKCRANAEEARGARR